MNSRYSLDEGTIDLPEGFHDRTTNIFMLGRTAPSPLNLNIARDVLLPGETPPAYVDRQIALLKKNMRGYTLEKREPTVLGGAAYACSGEQITSTYKNGAQTIYQRQAAFIHREGRALIFSCTSVREFDEQQEALWAHWLASFQPCE